MISFIYLCLWLHVSMCKRTFLRGYIIDYELDSFTVLKPEPRLSHESRQLEYVEAMDTSPEFQLAFVRWF